VGYAKNCLPAVVASLVVLGTSLRADGPIPLLSNPQHLLATDAGAFARLLKTARPTPISAENKARVMSSLPDVGEVTRLNSAARQKVAGLLDLLRATERDTVYEIKVIDVPQAGVGLYARAVIVISETALTLVNANELQALLAHEIGHEYIWAERERAVRLADHNRLKDLELACDAIAIVTLHELGMDVSRLMTGVEKITRFNQARFGAADNEADYPTLAKRRAFAGAVAAWTSARSVTAGTECGVATDRNTSGAIVPQRIPSCRTPSASGIPITSIHR
jgi:hypothetical protein